MYLCAWCEKNMKRPAGNLQGEPTVKHGICDCCLEQQLAKLEAQPPAIELHAEPAFAAA